jgi:hypothetical protein
MRRGETAVVGDGAIGAVVRERRRLLGSVATLVRSDRRDDATGDRQFPE